MLDRAAAAASTATARPAPTGGAARQVSEDSRFQGRLRDALEPSQPKPQPREGAQSEEAAPAAKGDDVQARAPEAIRADAAAPTRDASDTTVESAASDETFEVTGALPGQSQAPDALTPQQPSESSIAPEIMPPLVDQPEQDLINLHPMTVAAGAIPTAANPAAPETLPASTPQLGPEAIKGQSKPAPETLPASTPQLESETIRGQSKATPLSPNSAMPGQATDMPRQQSASTQAGGVGTALADQTQALKPVAQMAQPAPSAPAMTESTSEQPKFSAETLVTAPLQAAAQAANTPRPAGAPSKASSTPLAEAIQSEKPTSPTALLAKALGATDAAPAVKLVTWAETAETVLHLTAVEAPKAAAAKPGSEARAESPSLPLSGFTVPETQTQRAEAPLPSAATRDMAPPTLPARQLAPVVVSLALGRGDEALTIALDPVELGRVEVSIGQGREAGQVRIVAERPETLALLQRDQRELDRALNQAGLGDMARSMSFSLASDQGRQQHHGTAHQGGQGFLNAMAGRDADQALAPMPIPAPARTANSLIDIAV